MTSLITLNIDTSDDLLDQHITSATNEQLLEALSSTAQVTAKYISLLAKIWRELETRGVDLSDLKSGIAYYLPMIADNRLDPSAVLAFAGQQLLLREISLMPISKQISLVEGEKGEVVNIDSNGETTTILTSVGSLHSRYYSQVFNLGRVRSVKEQLSYLRGLGEKKAARRKLLGKPVKKKKVTYDNQSDAVVFDNTAVLFNDVIKAIAIKTGTNEDRVKLAIDSLAAGQAMLSADG